MRRFNFYILASFFVLMFPACGVDLPEEYIVVDSLQAEIYPDYRDIVVPCNIAPLNFVVKSPCQRAIVEVLASDGTRVLAEADGGAKVKFPLNAWKKMVGDHVSSSLSVNVYVKNKKWVRYNSFQWHISPDSIDPLLTCRLIEPSYRVYGSLSLTSFDLESNSFRNIAENDALRGGKSGVNQCCMNCHSQQKNGSGNSLFHYRGKNGGLVLTYNGESKIVNTKVGDLYASATYSAWHPFLPIIAFSVNVVGQVFPSVDNSKVEIEDSRSDLVLYDIERNEISYIMKTKDKLETFPCWSADGKHLFYATSDSVMGHVTQYKKMKYDIACVPFNVDSMRFGEPKIVFSASSMGKSASQPKASPDGKFLLFSVSKYGCSPYRHEDCDLYQMSLETGETRNLSEINSSRSDAYHDWSFNSKWIVFSSRREDGNYARPFFAHCDSTGHYSKPFQIPHEDPTFDWYLLKSYNAPEFAQKEPILSPSDVYDLLEKEPVKCHFSGKVDGAHVDAASGASILH